MLKENFYNKIRSKKVPVLRQANMMDCGPTCLQMISSYYGRYYNLETLRAFCGLSNTGVNLLGIKNAAEKIGFRAGGVKLTSHELLSDIQTPVILFWRQKHFVVLPPQKGNPQKKNIKIIDPGEGNITISRNEFLQSWSNNVDEDGEAVGFALFIEPQAEFYVATGEQQSVMSWRLIARYLSSDYARLFYIILTILFSVACQLAIPFLTKGMVDHAIRSKSIKFLNLIITAQFGILLSKMVADFIRAKFLLLISTFININMSKDFWRKLMRLPLSFFETRRGGDIFQKLSDNNQVQNFLTGPAINTTFSVLNLVTFGIVLFTYNGMFFTIFILGVAIYCFWISFFFQIKRRINNSMNALATKQNDLSLQFVHGMSEIRIGGNEKTMLKEWDLVQKQIFELNSKSLRYVQIQNTGGLFINQGKDLLIIFLAATLVIEQKLTIGTLIAIQYIIGALSSPIEQLISFSQNVLDVKQSITRLNDIYKLENENKGDIADVTTLKLGNNIEIKNLSFVYPGAGNLPVLNKLNLSIPQGKVTAIVGLSGSGKTTLLKLLLRYYESYEGAILLGNKDLRSVNNKTWRKHCGVVLQDGYIFNRNIQQNIVLGEEMVDENKLTNACIVANILEFIKSLPNGFMTQLGVEGVNLSQGQKQRILIARAIYKNPDFLFFDEATNSLDADNEKLIVDNLKALYLGKTVIIIAHRLSTVKDADNIVVLNNGEIAEQGTHQELIQKNGRYFKLVKNQLELGV